MTRQEHRFKERWDSILDGAHNTVRVLQSRNTGGSRVAALLAFQESYEIVKAAEWQARADKADV